MADDSLPPVAITPEPSPALPSASPLLLPPSEPDYGLWVGIVAFLVAIIFFVLQSNGEEVSWVWSALIYTGCAAGIVWTTLRYALPGKNKGVQITASFALLVLCLGLGALGTVKQYRKEHTPDKVDELIKEVKSVDQQQRFLAIYPAGYTIFDVNYVTGSVTPIQARQGLLNSYEFDFRAAGVLENTPTKLTIQLPDVLQNGVHVVGHMQVEWDKVSGPQPALGYGFGTPPNVFAAIAEVLEHQGDHVIWIYGIKPITITQQ